MPSFSYSHYLYGSCDCCGIPCNLSIQEQFSIAKTSLPSLDCRTFYNISMNNLLCNVWQTSQRTRDTYAGATAASSAARLHWLQKASSAFCAQRGWLFWTAAFCFQNSLFESQPAQHSQHSSQLPVTNTVREWRTQFSSWWLIYNDLQLTGVLNSLWSQMLST